MIDCNITANYFAEKKRMTKLTKAGICKIGCTNCPLSSENNDKGIKCVDYEMHYPEEAVKIMQKWSDENPQKTYMNKLLKNYPNTPLGKDGTPQCLCPSALGLKEFRNCDNNCIECWNQPLKEGEE